MGAKVKGICWGDAEIRIHGGNIPTLLLRLKKGEWIRFEAMTLRKLQRHAGEQGYRFAVEKIRE
jgi:hypothetical protein